MCPHQTSLIPVTVAIARFLESNGLKAFLGNYHYWYLGLPARFLSGPVVPILQMGAHKLLPNISLFSITIYLVLLSFLLGAVGWGMVAKRISANRAIGVSVGLLWLILPWRYLSSLALGEASFVIARNLLPYALLATWQFLKTKDQKTAFLVVLAISFLLLINTSILPILIVGLSALILSLFFKKGKIKNVSKSIKPLLLFLAGSILVATFWYTPSYWLTILANPSIGGAAGFKVILRVFDLLKAAVPLLMAVVSVYFAGKIKDRFLVFSLTWTLTFLFLTVFRFIGDPDFWQDWTAWVYELEIGLALLISLIVNRISVSGFRFTNKIVLAVVLFLLPFLLTFYVYNLLGRPALITKEIPRGVQGLVKLEEIAGDNRVFLSGSTVFWANALSDLNQVRGGVDKAASHPYWDHAAYQLREGTSPELAKAWLEVLGTPYVLIHGPSSSETYHDFRNLGKWRDVGKMVWEERGDAVLEIPGVSLAWVVDLNKLNNTRPPKSGVDLESLSLYLAAKKRPLKTTWQDSNNLLLEIGDLNQDEGVVLAVSFDSKWKTEAGVSLEKDPLGNILIIPIDFFDGKIKLEYR